MLIRSLQTSTEITGLSEAWLPADSFATGTLNALGNMVGDLTLVYRLWIVVGDSWSKVWIMVPIATSILGAGMYLFIILQSSL